MRGHLGRTNAVKLGAHFDAPALLDAAGGSVKTAVVMARRKVGREAAERLLDEAGGRLAELMDEA